MRGLSTVILLVAVAAACSVTHTHGPPPPPPTDGDATPTPTPDQPDPNELPAINGAQVGVWESQPRIAGGDEGVERYVLGSDGRFVWQAGHHGDPEAHPEDASEGFERFGRWGSTDNGLVLREQRRMVSQLAFVECPGGEEQCECRDCQCDACANAGADCPCARQSSQQMRQPPTDHSLAVADCPEDVLERVAAEQNEPVAAPCKLIGETPFWHYPDPDDADLRIQDAWGSASVQ